MGFPRFEFHRPKTLDEVVELMDRFGEDAKLMAGGTDLLIRMQQKVIKPRHVIYLKSVDGLDGIEERDGGVFIGACATLSQVAESPLIREKFLALSNACSIMATTQVRNKGTVVGNLCNAAPSADTAPPLIAMEAKAIIYGKNGRKEVPLEEFFKGPGKTVLEGPEFVEGVFIPYQPENSFTAYLKFSHRSKVDIAIVGVASRVQVEDGICKDARIVLGAVAPVPMRARETESFVKGKAIDEEVAQEAGSIASRESKPITDVRATEEYRRHIVGVLTKRALLFSYQKAREV